MTEAISKGFKKGLIIFGILVTFFAGCTLTLKWLLLRELPQNRNRVLKVFFPQVNPSCIKSLDFVHRARQGGYRIYARLIADKSTIMTIIGGAEKAKVSYKGKPKSSDFDAIYCNWDTPSTKPHGKTLKKSDYNWSWDKVRPGQDPFRAIFKSYLDPWQYPWWDLTDVDKVLNMEIFWTMGKNRWTSHFEHYWLVNWEKSTVYLMGYGI